MTTESSGLEFGLIEIEKLKSNLVQTARQLSLPVGDENPHFEVDCRMDGKFAINVGTREYLRSVS